MRYKLLSKIGIRLIALFFILSNFSYIVGAVITVVNHLNQSNIIENYSLFLPIATMLLTFLLGICLWIFADKIADHMIGKIQIEASKEELDYQKVQYVAFSVAGLLIISDAVPDLISALYQIVALQKYTMNSLDKVSVAYHSQLITALLKSIFGIWLTLGSKGIINSIKKLKTAGLNDIEEGEDGEER
ncbi:hypothetical protein [Fusibacter ferrireducens]|uniref:Uncharacterized protein n=1 Tax=Fusibacter ferrireducens TaxID=2785058 RepID=A0ABR9ZQS9_9FIRM|nr:hypothetical protein [Fusibacter ferrireducens]MBF4691984.1 hypothetical protein [Fusibacter ferrireducens]